MILLTQGKPTEIETVVGAANLRINGTKNTQKLRIDGFLDLRIKGITESRRYGLASLMALLQR